MIDHQIKGEHSASAHGRVPLVSCLHSGAVRAELSGATCATRAMSDSHKRQRCAPAEASFIRESAKERKRKGRDCASDRQRDKKTKEAQGKLTQHGPRASERLTPSYLALSHTLLPRTCTVAGALIAPIRGRSHLAVSPQG